MERNENESVLTPRTFHDSYKKMPSSLSKLAKDYTVSMEKTEFPHDFVTYEKLEQNYVGRNPITGEDNFCLKNEAIFRERSKNI